MEIPNNQAQMEVSRIGIEGLVDGMAEGACEGACEGAWEGFAGGAYEGAAELAVEADVTIPELSLSGTTDNPAKTLTIPKIPITLNSRKGKMTWKQKDRKTDDTGTESTNSTTARWKQDRYEDLPYTEWVSINSSYTVTVIVFRTPPWVGFGIYQPEQSDLIFDQQGAQRESLQPMTIVWNSQWIKAITHRKGEQTGALTIPWLRLDAAEKIGIAMEMRTQDPTKPGGIGDSRKRFVYSITFNALMRYS
jgi:hypothetical protein